MARNSSTAHPNEKANGMCPGRVMSEGRRGGPEVTPGLLAGRDSRCAGAPAPVYGPHATADIIASILHLLTN